MSQHLRPIPFAEALRLAKERDVVLPDSYYGEIPRSLRSRSFSITGLASHQQIQGVLQELNRSLDAGETFEQWQDRVDAGEVSLDLPQHRRELVFRNHVQSQYNRGRFEALQEQKEDIPFLRYDAVNDSRTRPAHLAMDGHIAEQDAAVWDTWMPLNGHNCRCTVVGVTERRAQREGLGGGDTSKQPDPGWDYHPGKAPDEGVRRSVDQASDNAGAMAQNVADLQPPPTMSLDDALSAGDDELSDLQRRLDDELGDEAGDVATDATAMQQAIRTKLTQTGRRGEAPRNIKGNKANQALLADATADLPDTWKRATDRSTRVRLRKQNRRAFHFRAPEQPNQSNGTFRARFRGLGNVDLNPRESLISFNSERSALHEYVHAVQHSAPELDDYFQELFERRTQGDQLRQIQIGEFAKPDDFVTSYAGRVYDDPSGAKAYLGRAGALEVMTITYEYLLSPVTSRRQELIDKDPELAKLALALLFRYDP